MIVVSSCLVGFPCRYDGKVLKTSEMLRLEKDVIPICPEVLGGLSTPRAPAEIIEEDTNIRVHNCNGVDVTHEYYKGARLALSLALQFGCTAAVLKDRSPSCGIGFRYDGTFTGTLTSGDGVTATLFKRHGMQVFTPAEWARL
jgi:uncharacterized protein YbbK (DUF523 family)